MSTEWDTSKLEAAQINERAILGAFSDENGTLPEAVRTADLDVVRCSDDCLLLLVATGISLSSFDGSTVAADDGLANDRAIVRVADGDIQAAARLAAARLAATWSSK